MNDLNLLFTELGALSVIAGFVLYSLAAPIVFFIKEENGSRELSHQKYDFIIWPARAAQFFFDSFWGKVGKGKFGVLTWRSFWATLTFSVLINLICVGLILGNAPPDMPRPMFEYIGILFYSKIFFILCNFIGDFFSVNITRYLLDRIIHSDINSWRYIVFDILGIIGGYLLMLLPAVFFFLFGSLIFENPNDMIQIGLFGNILIPFFLGIFAISTFPSLLAFFSSFAIFSITLPTIIYLFLIIFVNTGYQIYHGYVFGKKGWIRENAKIAVIFGQYLALSGSALFAITVFI